jgi:hypothetical protein
MDDFGKYNTIPYEVRDHCSVCGNVLPGPIISYPKLPLTEIYTPRPIQVAGGVVDQHFHI